MAGGDSGSPQTPRGQHQVVEGYGGGRFRVNGRAVDSSVIVFADETVEWSPRTFAEVDPASLDAVIARADDIDILLLGCGERMELVPSDLRDALRRHGIVIEPMDTGAAARTFNLLLSEGRQVAAALLLV